MKVFQFRGIFFHIGQSAKENWELLDKAKAENQNYIWFHLESFPSPYVIMWSSISDLEKFIETQNEFKNLSIDHYLAFGANQCKLYSKYSYLNDLKIMYTTVQKLTKTDKVGEVDIKGKYKIIGGSRGLSL